MAVNIAETIKKLPAIKKGKLIHIFVAAPISFMFYLGQNAAGFGNCTIYEYNYPTGLYGVGVNDIFI